MRDTCDDKKSVTETDSRRCRWQHVCEGSQPIKKWELREGLHVKPTAVPPRQCRWVHVCTERNKSIQDTKMWQQQQRSNFQVNKEANSAPASQEMGWSVRSKEQVLKHAYVDNHKLRGKLNGCQPEKTGMMWVIHECVYVCVCVCVCVCACDRTLRVEESLYKCKSKR